MSHVYNTWESTPEEDVWKTLFPRVRLSSSCTSMTCILTWATVIYMLGDTLHLTLTNRAKIWELCGRLLVAMLLASLTVSL